MFEELFGSFFSSIVGVTFGFRVDYSTFTPDIASAAVTDSLKFDQMVIPFLYQIWIDTLDRLSFPTSGVLILFKNEFAPENFASENSFSRHYFDLRAVIPVDDSFSLFGEMMLGTSSGDLPRRYGFALGGLDRPALFPDRLLTSVSFVGLKSQELFGKHAQFFQLGFQYELRPKYFLTLRVNAGNTFDEWRLKFSRNRFESGVGLTLGRATPVGPVEVTAMGGSRHRFLTHLNIGFRF